MSPAFPPRFPQTSFFSDREFSVAVDAVVVVVVVFGVVVVVAPEMSLFRLKSLIGEGQKGLAENNSALTFASRASRASRARSHLA